MNQPRTAISCVSNVFIRQMHFLNAGDKEQSHAHCFDHVTLLSAGKLQINALGKSTEFVAPHHIFIKANVVHELIALEDNTVAHCIHALRDGERVEDIIDPASLPISYNNLPENAYPLTKN